MGKAIFHSDTVGVETFVTPSWWKKRMMAWFCIVFVDVCGMRHINQPPWQMLSSYGSQFYSWLVTKHQEGDLKMNDPEVSYSLFWLDWLNQLDLRPLDLKMQESESLTAQCNQSTVTAGA